MVKDHHLWLSYHPSLFHDFKCFIIKDALAHSVIQKGVDELLAKHAIESSTGGASFTAMSLLFLNVLAAYGHTQSLAI